MKKNVKVLAAAGVAAVALVGGTFAYYQSTLTLDNPLDTGHEGTVLVEDFTPPTDEFKPGQSLDKLVTAENTGNYPVLVRIKMDENWTRKLDEKSVVPVPFATWSSGDNDFNTAVPTVDNGTGETYYVAKQGLNNSLNGDTDGEYGQDKDNSVVYKELVNVYDSEKHESAANTWVYGGDSYWYWNGVLAQDGGVTDPIMEKLALASNIDLGFYKTTEYYAIAESQPDVNEATEGQDDIDDGSEYVWKIVPWTSVDMAGKSDVEKAAYLLDWAKTNKGLIGNNNVYRKSESYLDPERLGYSNAIYTLKVTSEFVQANADAVAEAWKKIPGGKTAWFGADGFLTNVTVIGDDENNNLKSVVEK